MSLEKKIDASIVDKCYIELREVVYSYICEKHYDEALEASVHLLVRFINMISTMRGISLDDVSYEVFEEMLDLLGYEEGER